MNLKADMSEVDDLSDKVSTAQDKIVTELNNVNSGVDDIINMDDFSGEAADSAKGYFENVHKTVALALQQLMIEIDDNLKSHINTFHSDVDESEKARINKHYLEEVKGDIETTFETLEETNDEVLETIEDVEDIVSVTKPNFSPLESEKDSIDELIEGLVESLESYSKKATNR